jgi:quercetin dioxygenase-like cupin family protein
MLTRQATLLGAALCAATGMFAAGAAAETSSAGPAPLTYVHLYTDAAGVSHFKEAGFDFRAIEGPDGKVGPLSMHAVEGAEGAALLRLKHGVTEDWHKAPRRQLVIALQGIVEVTASDGEKRRFLPGQIMLMDDTQGKGHVTSSLGDEDHVALMIPLPAQAAATAP